MDIAGKHIFITGAAKRLGRAIAEHLIPHKVKLTAHFHSSEKQARELVSLCQQKGGQAQALSADLRSLSAIQTLFEKATAKFGPVEILINSASTFFPTPLGTVTEEQWDELFLTNLKSHFFLTQHFVGALKKTTQKGVVINLCDVNARRALKNFTPYVSAKAGLLAMTRNLAKELAPQIRVNSISPGPVLLPENYTPEQRKSSEEKTLLKRLGTPDDIAEAVKFLIENEYVTGQDLAVDGGRELA